MSPEVAEMSAAETEQKGQHLVDLALGGSDGTGVEGQALPPT